MATLLAFIKGLPLIKLLGAGGLGLLMVFLSFKWGQSDQKADHAEKQLEIATKYAESVSKATSTAFTLGIEAARQETKNNDELDQIVREAQGLENADGVCVSADLVERLRNLQ